MNNQDDNSASASAHAKPRIIRRHLLLIMFSRSPSLLLRHCADDRDPPPARLYYAGSQNVRYGSKADIRTILPLLPSRHPEDNGDECYAPVPSVLTGCGGAGVFPQIHVSPIRADGDATERV
jgi:hypothetical protein